MLILGNIGTLYDGTGYEKQSLKTGVDLFIEKGKIADVKPHNAALAGGSATYIDCKAYTVTPGLIDCHGHVTTLGLKRDDMELMNGGAALVYVEKILYRSLVEGGVTTIRDVGGATHLMKRLVDEGVILGPRLKIAICMLSTTGGHADFRGPDRCHSSISSLWPEGPGRPSSVVDGPWECRKRVREIAACGADLIKICASPGVASPRDNLSNRDFTPEEVAAICDEAAGRGLRVAAHAHSANGIELAIDNGVNDIQHISLMDERMAEKAAKKNCTVTPTSWVVNTLHEFKGLSDFVIEKAKRVAESHSRATELAVKYNLKILGGTDPVLRDMHGRNYVELTYLIKEGVPPLRAWFGMTGLAAKEIGIPETGTLVPGQRADVLLCKGNVIEKPETMKENLVEVIKDGEAYRGAFPNLKPRTYASNIKEILEGTDS